MFEAVVVALLLAMVVKAYERADLSLVLTWDDACVDDRPLPAFPVASAGLLAALRRWLSCARQIAFVSPWPQARFLLTSAPEPRLQGTEVYWFKS